MRWLPERVEMQGAGQEPRCWPSTPTGRGAELPTPQLQTAARAHRPGLLGLSGWLVCLFAAHIWQEGAGEAGRKLWPEGRGKWPAWLPLPRRHPKYENHEEGQAGKLGGRAWLPRRSTGKTGASGPGYSPPSEAKGGPGSPGQPPGSREHQPLQTRGLQAPGKSHPAHAHLSNPQSPQFPLRPFSLIHNAHSRHFPDPGDNAWVYFLESSGVWPGREH